MSDSERSPDDAHPERPLPDDAHRILVENVPNGVLVLFDADLRYRIVGPSVLPFSGRAASDMEGRTVEELFPPWAVAELEPELRRTLDGEARSFDIDYGEEIHHVETRPATVDGEPCGVLLTQAVTEERRLARELERKNERLDRFASMVSHDLRTPLSVALGRLEQYRATGEASHLDGVEDALARMEELTTGLSALARDDEPTGPLEPVPVADAARDAWALVDTRSATLSTERFTVEANSGQLRTLFENLFRNAVGHGGYDVIIRVGPLDDGGFYVEDTGEGIPPEEREQVFEHGFSTGYGGSGVGLAIVDRIAEAHGWDVSLDESAEGGARFEFRAGEDGE